MLSLHLKMFSTRLSPQLRFLRKPFFIIFLSLQYPTLVFADDLDIKNMLGSMSEAVRTLNYQGRFMYVLGNDMSSFQVQHAVIKGKEHERLVFLNEKQQEFVRIGHDIFCIHPGNDLLREHQDITTNPFADKLSAFNKGIEEHYEISIIKDQMVAGREAYRINFNSKDGNRYNHALWVDAQSYLLLKADISDPVLGTLESFEYVQVEIGNDIPASVFAHKNYEQHVSKHFDPPSITEKSSKVNRDKASSVWEASWLPEGFYFSGATQEVLKHNKDIKLIPELEIMQDTNNTKDIRVDMLMYTDGIAAITVFVEAMDKVGRFSESSQKGAVSAYSHAARIDKQDFMITVVGEIPLQTAERVAKGMSQNRNSNQP